MDIMGVGYCVFACKQMCAKNKKNNLKNSSKY